MALKDTDAIQQLTSLGAREIIRSLVDGIVPHHGARLFTAGREVWLRGFEEDLDDLADDTSRVGRLRVLNGRNGDGKTHLMHLIIDQALGKGFAVSYVVVSEQVPLSKWALIYAAIGRSIVTRSRPDLRGLREALNPASPDPTIAEDFAARAGSIRSVPGIEPNFATAVYRYCTQQTVNTDWTQDLLLLGQWLEGTGKALPEMAVQAPVNETNAADMLRSLVLAMRHFGYRGLVVLVDEVESVLALPKRQREASYQTLRLLVDRQTIPNHALIVASTTPAMFTDPERGMRSYPALWSRVRPEKVQDEFVDPSATIVDLTRTPLGTEDYTAIGESIRAIHARAREWNPAPRIPDAFLRRIADVAASGQLTLTFSATRVAVKLIAETLELAYRHPEFDPVMTDPVRAFGDVDERLTAESVGSDA